jgi:hypothetical protein
MKIRVEDLRTELWPLVEGLFGKNGACGGCWCQAWRIAISSASSTSCAFMRAAVAQAITRRLNASTTTAR